jgi:hypothetical protein
MASKRLVSMKEPSLGQEQSRVAYTRIFTDLLCVSLGEREMVLKATWTRHPPIINFVEEE